MPLPDRTIYTDGLYPHKINELASEARSQGKRIRIIKDNLFSV